MALTPEQVKDEHMRLLARVSKVMSVSLAELREALDAQWEGYYNEVANAFTWAREDGFHTTIQVSDELLSWNSMDDNPEDASSQFSYLWVMAATRAYAAGAWVLAVKHHDTVPREVIP